MSDFPEKRISALQPNQQKITDSGARKFIEDLKMNDHVHSKFAVKYKRPLRDYAKGYWFTVGLSDRTGEIDLTYWGGHDQMRVQKVWDSFEEGDVVLVDGFVSEYKQKKKIDVNEGKGEIVRTTEFRIEDFVAECKRDADEMFGLVMKEVDSVKDPLMKKLLMSFFGDSEFVSKFKKSPAAMYMHHAYLGGLLEHSLHVMQLCLAMHAIYPQLDRDLLVTGALLHDVGKVREFEVGTSIQVSEEGMLRGHVVVGEELVVNKMNALDFPEVLKLKIAHILLSHHGKGEYGAPKEPQFAEAATVNFADVMDSQVDQYIKIKETTDSKDFRIYTKRLGELYLK